MNKLDYAILLATRKEAEVYAAKNRVPIVSQAGAALLMQLVAIRQPKRILEIGTAIGYSAMVIAATMPAGAAIVTIEQTPDRFSLAQDFLTRAGLLPQVRMCCGDARQILPDLSGPFDLVFIDAAKGQYPDYLAAVREKLSCEAVIVADNVLFRGLVEEQGIIPRRYRTIVKRLREYLNLVNDPRYFCTTVHRDGDGIAVSYYQGRAIHA